MIEPSLRYIVIDDLTIGYDYPKKEFYITNKGTTTYRDKNVSEEPTNLYNVLTTVFGIELTDELKTQILACRDNVETLGTNDSLFYTWEETGSYIYSIQFNEWSDYCLILEAEKNVLRVDNSEVVIDLTTGMSIETIATNTLCPFYRNTLGLSVTVEEMTSICNFLLYFYKPTCINLIQPITEDNTELRYSNQFKVTNYNNTAKATYICTNDPLNNSKPLSIGNITSIDTSSNTITLLEPIQATIIEEYNIKKGSKLLIQGTKLIVDETEYTDDGTYTINNISDTVITVEEQLPVSYNFPYYLCYVKTGYYTIQSISRDNNTITLTASPSNILIGDKITVEGANIEASFETIQVDNTYTVQSIVDNVITVEEEIPTNHEYTDTSAKVIKEVYISPISEVHENTLKLLNPTEYNLVFSTIIVYNSSIDSKQEYLVQSAELEEGLYSTLTVNRNIEVEEGYPSYPTINYPTPSEDIMVDVTYVSATGKEILPIGKFIVDNYEEADKYIGLFDKAIKPSDMNKSYEDNKNLYQRDIKELMYKKIQDTIEIPIIILGELNYKIMAKCLGIKLNSSQ